MSRWSKHTPEEKQAILSKLQSQETAKLESAQKQDPFDTDYRLKILESGELPLYCSKCGVTTSEKYTLNDSQNPMMNFFGKVVMINGTCKTCGHYVDSPIPVDPLVMFSYASVISRLKSSGRLTDKRKHD